MARVKKEAIREVIRNFLFEAPSGASIKDMNYGIYNQPGPSWDEEEDVETTVPDDVPLKPTEMMSNQLVDERPPIEDDEYIPANSEELSRAARALSQMVPDGQVDFFYKNLHKLLDKATDRENSPDLAPTGVEEKEKEALPVKAGKEQEKKEAFIRRHAQFLIEQINDGEEDEYDDYRRGEDAPEGYQEVDLSEFEPAAEAAVEAASAQPVEGMTFEDLAGQFGFSGVPGVRQYIDRITSRMEHFVTKTTPEDIETLQDQASQEFIDLMLSSDYIDEEDAVELQQAPGEVKSLDSFRFFFVSAFVMPAYQQISRDAKKRVKTELDSMGIPEKMRQTVINQVMGQVARDRGAIAKKLDAAADASNMSPEDRTALAQRLTTGFPTLKKLAELDEDLVKVAMAKWGSINPAKRSDLLAQAMESTSEFQQQFDNA